jgi:hypothetical protein
MRVVADKMACATVHRAEQESDVVFIDGIVAKVKIFDFDDFGEEGELAQEARIVDSSTPRLRSLRAYSAAMSFEISRVKWPWSQRSMISRLGLEGDWDFPAATATVVSRTARITGERSFHEASTFRDGLLPGQSRGL